MTPALRFTAVLRIGVKHDACTPEQLRFPRQLSDIMESSTEPVATRARASMEGVVFGAGGCAECVPSAQTGNDSSSSSSLAANARLSTVTAAEGSPVAANEIANAPVTAAVDLSAAGPIEDGMAGGEGGGNSQLGCGEDEPAALDGVEGGHSNQAEDDGEQPVALEGLEGAPQHSQPATGAAEALLEFVKESPGRVRGYLELEAQEGANSVCTHPRDSALKR